MLTATDPERRVEDWLTSHLDEEGITLRTFQEGLEAMLDEDAHPSQRARPQLATRRGSDRPLRSAWKRLIVARRKQIVLIRFRDAALLREDDIAEAIDELGAIVGVGHHRIVLSFAGIERMSSQLVTALAAAHRACEARDGGQFRVCYLEPELAEALTLTGLAGRLALFEDEKTAVTTPWPEPKGPRLLPIHVFQAMRSRAKAHAEDEGRAPTLTMDDPDGPALGDGPDVWLLLRGEAGEQVIAVEASPFFIGRDPSCHLYTDHPTVSRRHACLERRSDSVLLRDLGASNGTQLNGQLMTDVTTVLRNGDRIQLGPYTLTVRLGVRPEVAPPSDDEVLAWLSDDADGETGQADDTFALADETLDDVSTIPEDDGRPFRVEVIEGVLVITPQLAHLNSDEVVASLRDLLLSFLEGSSPRRVVVHLNHMETFCSRGIGILLAHSLRLEREGGALRICEPSARVAALFEHVGVPMLVGVYPALDDAVLASWD
jgi:anti-anti-sigma factor